MITFDVKGITRSDKPIENYQKSFSVCELIGLVLCPSTSLFLVQSLLSTLFSRVCSKFLIDTNCPASNEIRWT